MLDLTMNIQLLKIRTLISKLWTLCTYSDGFQTTRKISSNYSNLMHTGIIVQWRIQTGSMGSLSHKNTLHGDQLTKLATQLE